MAIVECYFFFLPFFVKKSIQAIHRAKLPVLANQISPSKYNGLRPNKASTLPQHRNKEVGKRNKRYM